ncbi:MAG: MoaD/ThiS family protein [Bacteroidetes bacterium]|nr:MoaD/ThiS family protein [Bacteroidota bacterium]
MSIQVKLFGLLVDIVGKTEIDITSINDTDSLKKKMLNDFPKLKGQSFVIVVSKQMVKGNQTLKPGDVAALLPPFAGG